MGIQLSEILRPGQTRGLDFVILDELTKRTGILPQSIMGFAVSEILCNALDKGASTILIEVTEDDTFNHLKISDNGDRKLGIDDLNLILDFDNKASSKRGFLRVSRGYLGNALKCIFGFSYAIAERDGIEPLPIIVSSGAETHTIRILPDKVYGIIRSRIETSIRDDNGYTSIQVSFPHKIFDRAYDVENIKDIIFATSMVNPNTVIEYSVYGDDTVKLNDSEFFDWLIMVNKDGGLFVTSPSNSWLDKDGVKKYKQLIKFNKTLHSEIQVEILKKYSSDVVPGADDGDDVPY
jgi:hypothetical protein